MTTPTTTPDPLTSAPAPDTGAAGAVVDPEVLLGGFPPRLVTGRLVAANADVARFELSDGSPAWLPRGEFYPNRPWNTGWWYVLAQVTAGPNPQLSTTRPEMIPLLIASYAPEVRDGRVRVMAVAREPGVRTKVAVAATEPGVDPVAACIGRGANRIQRVSADLGGERVDVVAWHDDPAVFIRNALGPVAVVDVRDGGDGTWHVIVETHAASAAVGGGGMNVRVAGALAGRRLSVRTVDDPTTPVRLGGARTPAGDRSGDTDAAAAAVAGT